MLKRRQNHGTVIINKIKHLTKYKVSLFIQGLTSIVFLYAFYQLNKTTAVLDAELNHQITTSQKLQRIVDSIEQQIVFFSFENSLKKSISIQPLDTGRKRNLSPQKNSVTPQSSLKPGEKIKAPSNVPVIVVTEETKTYEYEFSEELRLSNWETITEIKGTLNIKYDVQKQPKNYNAQIEMKQTNEKYNGAVQKLTFRCFGCEVKPDNNFLCIFEENPLPAANELDAQNPRKLAITITGSLDNLGMNGLLEWKEVSGRPMTLRIKMVLKKTN